MRNLEFNENGINDLFYQSSSMCISVLNRQLHRVAFGDYGGNLERRDDVMIISRAVISPEINLDFKPEAGKPNPDCRRPNDVFKGAKTPSDYFLFLYYYYFFII